MLKLILTFSFCLVADITFGQDAQYYFNAAKQAFERKDHAQFYSSILKAHERHPYNQNILWYAGIAAALNDHPEEAIGFLKRAIYINAGYDLDDPNLISLHNQKAFQKLLDIKKQLQTPVIQSDTAFILQDRQIHLESVAFDSIANTLYGGSIHKRKIIKIDDNGAVSDFTTSEQHGMGAVFGLKVDEKKRVLWACSSPTPEMQHYDSVLISKLYQFDLTSGKLLNAYPPSDTLAGHTFGDVALNSKGEPFVSDSYNNVIYRYDDTKGKLDPFFSSAEFWNIQGLAFSDNDSVLYISDYVKGIFALKTQTLVLTKVQSSYDLSLKGTDGVIFFNNSLITLQNGVQPNRVVRHFLDESGSAFVSYEFIDNGHPAFGEPTIGSISRGFLYYVANSQWNGYENGKIKDTSALNPVVILKYNFKERR